VSSPPAAFARPYVPRVNRGGNYCGHDPDRPRFSPIVSASDKIPKVLLTLAERLDDYYKTPSLKLPSLCYVSSLDRRQRSERREACILVLKFLIRFLDMRTLTVAIPKLDAKGKQIFSPLRLCVAADHTGLALRRVSRAIHDLTQAGLITSGQKRIKNEDGSYCAMPALRAVNRKLFEAFGLGSWFDKSRAHAVLLYRNAVDRFKKYGRKMTRTQKARESMQERHRRSHYFSPPITGQSVDMQTDGKPLSSLLRSPPDTLEAMRKITEKRARLESLRLQSGA